MNKERIYDILKQRHLHEIYYDERPVWIQEVNDNVARVGFIDNNEEKDVYIEDLYEGTLYADGENRPD